MSTTDRVSLELQEAEKEIDNYYTSNPLLKLPFATAAWHFLAFAEDKMFKQTTLQLTPQEFGNMCDNFINDLKVPMYWLYRDCIPEGKIPSAYDANIHKASLNLLKIGQKYRWFVVAFVCHTQRKIKLEIQGQTIQPVGNFFEATEEGIEYEAYNDLITSQKLQEASSMLNFDSLPIDSIERTLRVKGDRFRYKLDHKIVSGMISCLKPFCDNMFILPRGWKFSRYSLGDFRKVFEAILAMAVIHLNARIIAIKKGCQNMAYLDSIYLPTCSELLRRVVKYSHLPDEMVQSILDDLTYGNRGIKHPDPALQPLIKLNSKDYAIMPNLWICSAAERNLTILLNKLPSEKKIYRTLVSEKEALMRKSIIAELSEKGFSFISEKVTNPLPDIDLAIVSDSEKVCLLLELKWFIDPAEAREIIEKSKEIEKGISQIQKLKQAYTNNHKLLLEKLNIDSSYRLEGIVVSQNWIGNAEVRSPEVPVIRVDHLIAKLKVTNSLRSTMDWLQTRKYLPIEGKHFKIVKRTYTIGKWYLKWYRIKPLTNDPFFPL